eukprot:ctg_123.g34
MTRTAVPRTVGYCAGDHVVSRRTGSNPVVCVAFLGGGEERRCSWRRQGAVYAGRSRHCQPMDASALQHFPCVDLPVGRASWSHGTRAAGADGAGAVGPRGARLRHLLSPAQGAYRGAERADHRFHGVAPDRPAAVFGVGGAGIPAGYVHPLAWRGGVGRPGGVRHHAIHLVAGAYAVSRTGQLHGLAAAVRWRAAAPPLAAQCPRHDSPAQRSGWRAGVRHCHSRQRDTLPARPTAPAVLAAHRTGGESGGR